jgi:tetratricopeptide (TPR) repeat protein
MLGAWLLLGAAGLGVFPGCDSTPPRPEEPAALRAWLLGKAEEKLRHAFRISEKYSNVPFNAARKQLIYVFVHRGDYGKALAAAESFLAQKREYLTERKDILLGNELAWEKRIAGDPKLKGTKVEDEYIKSKSEVEGQIHRAESDILGILLLMGDIFLRKSVRLDGTPGEKEALAEAVGRFKAVLDIRPDHAQGLARLGQTHAKLRDWALAAGYLDRAVQRMTEVLEDLEDTATGLDTKKPADRKRLAWISARQQLLLGMREEILATLGLCHFLGREYESFEDAFRRILALNADSVYLGLKIGLRLLRDGHRTEGIREVEKFLIATRGGAADIRRLVEQARNAFLKTGERQG